MHAQSENQESLEKISLVESLGSHLSTLAGQQVAARIPIERRWLEDIRQYQGKYSAAISTKLKEKAETYSRAFINATRHKTNAGEAIIGDVLFPNDQKNWGVEPTPVPQMVDDLDNKEPVLVDGEEVEGEDGETVTRGTVAKRAIEIAKEKAAKMEKQIEDQFVECDFNGEAREALHWSAMLGTGVIKGPITETSTRKNWAEGEDKTWHPNVISERTAGAKAVNPFHIYPDMTAAKINECEFIFEVSYPIKRQVQDLKHDPSIMKEQLIKVLMTGPSRHLTATQYQESLRAISDLQTITSDKRYELWQYRGPIELDVLLEAGVIKEDKLSEGEQLLEQYYGVVWLIGQTVIKISLNPDGFEPFPYYFYAWERDHSCLFGYGIPYLMRQSQKIINVAWRQMLDNSSNTAGPQIVIDKGVITPEDGDWNIVPFKVWNKKRGATRVQDAFQVLSFNNHQGEIANIYSMAQQIADDESGVPKLVEGQQGKAQTLGEASLQQNNSNNVTRRRVREWDDNVTKPCLRQFYDWNMRFSSDNSIKGDFKVKATGSSTLLVRDQNQQALMQVARDLVPHPTFAPYMKVGKILRKLIQSYHLDDKELVLSDDDVQSQQSNAQEEMSEPPQDELAAAKLDIERQKLEMKQSEMEFNIQKQASQEKLALMKLASQEKITQAQLEAKLNEVELKEKVNLKKFMTEIKLKMQVGQGI